MPEADPTRVAVFFGAGASCFGNFPTVDSFFKSVDWPPGSGFEAACQELARIIANNEGTKENVAWPAFNAEKILGWLETLEKAGRISEVPRIRVPRTEGQGPLVGDLISHLRGEIVRVYGRRTETRDIVTTAHVELFKFLDAITPPREPLHVFTTNYDTVLEQLFENWSDSDRVFKQKLNLCTGFPSGRRARWEPKLFAASPEDGERLVRLVKLHGSVTWKKDGTNPPVETGWSGPTPHDCLLYFGYKSIPEEEPFIALHNILKNVLLESEAVIAVGFRFADPYIREVFDFALRAKKRLRIICSLTRQPPPESPLSKMMTEHQGRVDLLKDSSGDPLPFGDDRFSKTLEQILT